MVALFTVVAYLMLGLLTLALLNGRTRRIAKQITSASEKMQEVAIRGAGIYVSPKVAVAAVLLSLWVFWPAAMYGRIKNNHKNRVEEEKRQEAK